jgi:hypothetical protein
MHGRERESVTHSHELAMQQNGERALVVTGCLNAGPFLCDYCNAELAAGQTAWLFSSFPGWMAETLSDYDFRYERAYFTMTKRDTATVYGTPWPDDSIRRRRYYRKPSRPAASRPHRALDLFMQD